MSFAAVRRTLFTVHMWVGLVLGLFLAALGLSGSALVYDDAIGNLLDRPPQALTAGMPLPLSMIQSIARDAADQQGVQGGQMQIILPEKPLQPITVRLGGISVMGNMPGMTERRGREGARGTRREGAQGPGRAGGLQLFIDPVSGEVLGSRKAAAPGLLIFAHQLHGNFLIGRDGRTLVVGWLGVAMCILGLSGLVLWWPRKGQWKYAFKVRSTASGLRFHRELHAATGIWIFLVFLAVSFSGVVIAWPQTFGMPNGRGNVPKVEPTQGRRLGATEAVISAQRAMPGLEARSVTIPAAPDQPISVGYLSNGAIAATAYVDPYRGTVLSVRDPSGSFMAWMRPVHQGSLGAVWKFLVFLSGLVPTLFVITGMVMWAKKRQRHVPMSEPLSEDLAEGEPA
ncbi:MAG TPA: PepSY-associated TM helix domain-containing protein [Rhizomicrobium sp.]|jgi:uncharacterized iron-regulated membrane protein